MRRTRDEAGGALFGFLIATFVFAFTFATVLRVSVDRRDETPVPNQANFNAIAASLADVLLTGPGEGWYGTTPPCPSGTLDTTGLQPEKVTRMGVGAERCAIAHGARERLTNVSFEKIQNLYVAGRSADPNDNALDYAEARKSLALDQANLDFHVRSWPILPSINAIIEKGYQDPYLRAMYLGDYERDPGGAPPPTLTQSGGYRDLGDRVQFYVSITNNGVTTTAFSVAFTLPTTHSIVTEVHTPILAPNDVGEASVTMMKSKDWAWKDPSTPQFTYSVLDPETTVASGTVSLAGLSMTSASTVVQHTVESAHLEWVMGGGTASPQVAYAAYTGSGSDQRETNWKLELRDALGHVVGSNSALNDKGGTATFSVNAAGTYDAVLLSSAGVEYQRDKVLVVTAELDPFETAPAGVWVAQPPVGPESAFLGRILLNFHRNVMDSAFTTADIPYAANGDVVPDDNHLLADWLPAKLRDANGVPTLANYDILVVGSGVDHRELTAASIKYTIRDWVKAGGTLIVFGSGDQKVEWLEPLFHVALESAGGALTTPDQNHPILHTPNQLDPTLFDPHGTAWQFHAASDAGAFDHVVQLGSDDVLAVSDPGAFGLGRIVLTSWQAWDLTVGTPPASCQPSTLEATCPGLQLMDNFLAMGYRSLYLDYGPPIPDGQPVGVENRIATIWDPELHQLVELEVFVYVFP